MKWQVYKLLIWLKLSANNHLSNRIIRYVQWAWGTTEAKEK